MIQRKNWNSWSAWKEMIIGNLKMINYAKKSEIDNFNVHVSWNSIQAFFDISLNFPRFCMLYDVFTVL